MLKTKQRILGLILCLSILFGQVSVLAASENNEFVSREKAVVSILETAGLGTLSEVSKDLSDFADADEISPEYADMLGIAVSNGILCGSAILSCQRTLPDLSLLCLCLHSENFLIL